MVIELLRAFFLIFFAEMGDKSQILAMTFATRYKLKHVLIGIVIGIVLNHSLAVLLGAVLPNVFESIWVNILAGVVFILFGYNALNTSEEVKDIKKGKYGIILTIALAIFIGELGDKTQLTTIILAMDSSYPLLILLMTVSAMISTSLLGIYVGIKFGSKIPEFLLKTVSSAIFIFFGILKILQGLPNELSSPLYFSLLIIVVLSFYLYFFFRYKRLYEASESIYKQKAEELRNYYKYIKDKLEDICLGETVCKTCQGNFCLLGYTKVIVRNTLNKKPVKMVNLSDKVRKDFSKSKMLEALDVTLNVLKDNWDNVEYHNIMEIRKSLELLLFDEVIEAVSYKTYNQILQNKKISIR